MLSEFPSPKEAGGSMDGDGDAVEIDNVAAVGNFGQRTCTVSDECEEIESR